MLRLVEVATYLTNQLNAIGETHTPAYTFNIQAEVGANKNAADVKGIIKSAKAKLPPVLNGRNAVYNLLMELQITAPTTNFNLKNIEEILNSFVNQVNGQEIAFSQGKGLVTMTLGQAGSFKTEVGQGGMVPLSYDIDINYTENVATSRSKHWLLQIGKDTLNQPIYEEIPYLSESVLISKEGRTNKINNKKYSETFMLGQQKRYRFTFLYDENSLLCQMIQKDILDGDANKTYKLKYYDGITYTAESPYITTVSLFETGDTKSDKPNTAQFDITFADADDGNAEIKYYMALIDNPFDEATENTKCFENTVVNGEVTITALENQHTWYQAQINLNKSDLRLGNADWEEIPAPNISALYLTNQIYKNSKNYTLFKVINKNYAIIKMQYIKNSVLIDEKWLYYWTKNPQVQVNGQVAFDLKMDTLQTYLFDNRLGIEGNIVERASLNRWIDNGDGTISFDGNVNSKLFERENLKQIAKRLVNRKKLDVKIDTTTNSYLNKWFNEHVYAWVYIYLSAQKYNGSSQRPVAAESRQAKVKTIAIDYVKSLTNSATHIDGATAVLCYPITDGADMSVYYKKNANTWTSANILADAFKSFAELNNGYTDVYSVKLSIKPPFPVRQYTETFEPDINANADYYIVGTNLRFIANDILTDDMLYGKFHYSNFGLTTGADETYGFLINVDKDVISPITLTLPASTMPKIKFNKTTVCGTVGNRPQKNSEWNPKLNNSDYKEFNLSFVGSGETYDIQKMNNENPTFEYYEPLVSDTTKGLSQYYSNNTNEIYGKTYTESYNGLSYTNNLSLPIANNQLDAYLANNKNAYLSFQNQQDRQKERAIYGMLGTVAGGAAGALTGGILKTVAPKVAPNSSGSSLGEGIGSAVQTGINYVATLRDQEYQRKQFDMTLDDMKSAPNILQNINGSAILAPAISQLGIYAEISEALPHEMQMANDDMFMNGFTYGKTDDVFKFINKTGSIHLRTNFNYLQAIIGNISGISMCSEARDDLRNRLANGVRFWRVNTIDYDHENYERWLEAPIVSGYASFTTTDNYINYYVLYNDILTKVTNTNKNNLGITAGTTIAYSNLA